MTKRIESGFLGGGEKGDRAYETKDGGAVHGCFL